MLCDDIQDMDLTKALQSLMTLFVNITQTLSAIITDIIKIKYVIGWRLKRDLSKQCLVIYAFLLVL